MITHLATPEELDGDEVTVEGDAYRHLFRARRLAIGDAVRTVDGHGRARWSEVTEVDRRRARLVLGDEAPTREPAYALELLVAPPRPERAAWLVEKATELGVVGLRFLAGERAPRTYGAGKLERFRRVAAAAACQCHRSRVPEVSGVHPWHELPELLAGIDDRFVLDPEAAGDPAAGARTAPAGDVRQRGGVVIGPEGGFTADERSELDRLEALAVGLGPRIETAAIAAAAQLLLPAW